MVLLTTIFSSPPARRASPWLAALLCAGCAVGPNYKRPATAAFPTFKEAAGWKTAAPADTAARAPWWEIFADPLLNELESQVNLSNQTVLQAAANYEEARQLARSDRTAFFPLVSAMGSASRSNGPSKSSASAPTVTLFEGALQASWEPDLWGRIRRTTEADVAAAQASAAELAAVTLSVQSALAQDYIQLRVSDAKKQLLTDAVTDYRRTLTISTNRYNAGVAAKSDVISARTQLDDARAQLLDVGVARSQLEHAIAVLLGRLPADFSVDSRTDPIPEAPAVPAVLPSDLLERRPDVAQSERSVAAANARVGIQTSAYFPAVSLTGSAGYQGTPLHSLFSAPFRFWSLGGDITDALLDWGQRHDQVLAAKAAYQASVAGYRQIVLNAFQQVEDSLSTLRILSEEETIQRAAVGEATDAAKIALNEYNAGTVDFTTVASAQVTELSNREALLGIQQSRLTSSVALIAAIGGGWSASDLPSP
jgi:NodT family efflux transporter outer membrane factor (OMF) lipoprotein